MKNRLKNREKLLKTILDNFKSIGISVIPPDSQNAIKKVEKRINKAFNHSLKSFYTLCDGYMLSWQGNLEGYKIYGQTSIRPVSILDSLNIGNNRTLSFANINADPDSFLILDRIDNLGNYVLLQIKDDDFLLYLYTYNRKLNKLNLSIEEYFTKAETYFGTELWQQFYIDNPSNISGFYIYDDRYTPFFEQFLEKEEFTDFKKALHKLNKDQIRSVISVDYKSMILKNIELLKQNKLFKVTEVDINYNVSPNCLIKAQESLGKELPKSMIDFYFQINGIHIEWTINNTTGKLNFLPLEEVFGGNEWYNNTEWNLTNYHKNNIWIGDNEDDEFYKITRELRPLELFSGDSGYVGFKYDDINGFEIYYAYGRNELMKLPISIDKYLKLSIRLLGLEGWQEYYRFGKDAKIGDANLIDEILSVFPDFKIEEFA